MSETKQRILLAALELFADKGYDAVSARDIAAEIGITKGALYRHYQNKRAIFDSIISEMELRDEQKAKQHDLPQAEVAEMAEEYANASMDDIIDFSKTMFVYWTEDEFASRFRKMLMLEQFKSSDMSDLYQRYLVSGPIGYLTDLFSQMGFDDPLQSSIEIYSPMFLMYSVFDGADDKQSAKQKLDAYLEKIRQTLKKEVVKP